MEIRSIPISKLHPAEYNPRIDLEAKSEEYKNIEKSINEFGCVEPIIWNSRTGNVVGGHQRLKVIIANGAETVECSVVDLNIQQEKALNIALNKVSGKWDEAKLAEIFAEFENMNIEVPTGFTADEITKLLDDYCNSDTDDDFDVEAEYKKILEPETRPGDVWQLGEHLLLCEDCTGDISELFADGKSADMMITDPPYNVDYNGGTSDKLKITNDNLTNNDFHNLLNGAFANAQKVLKPGGAFYIWYSGSETLNFYNSCIANNLSVRQHLIWVKNMFVLGRQDYHHRHEPCLYGWKSGAGHYFTDNRTLNTVISDEIDIDKLSKSEAIELLHNIFDKAQTDILNYDKPQKNIEHPTIKPIELFIQLIQNSSRRSEIVFDPFAGSGTTLIACEATGRYARIIEIDPKYCDVIVNRYKTNYPDKTVKLK